MKALGQAGLDFIANKYKELKELVGKKADKSEIITESEREEVKYLTDGYARYSLNEMESKLNAIVDAIRQFPERDSTLTPFMFAYDLIDGKITIPVGIDFPKCYAYQSWVFSNKKPDSFGFCGANYRLVSLETIAKTKKADNVEALVLNGVATVFDSAFAKARTLGTTDNYFVKKENGKGLSTNDYDNTAKSKVDAIPANPKYTDTTYDLSKYAEKSDISRCKTDGYANASSWSSVSSSRDLEDWIGDFDKRTRELRDSGGGELKTWVFGQNLRCVATKMGKLVVIFFNGQDFYDWGRRPTLPSEFRPAFAYFRNASSLNSGDKEIAFNCGSGTFVSILDSGEMRLMAYGRNASRGDAFAANIVYFTD